MQELNKNIWIPDNIYESNGIACGDTMTLFVYKIDNKIHFSYKGYYCSLTEKIIYYLENNYSGKEDGFILDRLNNILNSKYNKNELWIDNLKEIRLDCVESPILLLLEVFKEKINNIKCKESLLACDACVSVKPINWNNIKIKRGKNKKLINILKELKSLKNNREEYFQKLGICMLDSKAINNFNDLMDNFSLKDFDILKDLRLAIPYYNNYINYKTNINSKIIELATKQRISLKVAYEEIKIIEEFINKEDLKIESVKGNKVKKYYPENNFRVHMDFDYLAKNCSDAFKLISYLINERKFKIIIDGSVPFSLKNILDNNGNETLTGHIHLEKILQDNYQVIVDINMGGFPLGRTNIIKVSESDKLEIEDLICITLSHLFKHEHAFIKDINDLYFLLNSKELDKIKLEKKLIEHNLKNFFSIVNKFLMRIGMENKINIKGNYIMDFISRYKWPYSRKNHFYLKCIDMYLYNKKKFGIKKGINETISQICGSDGEIKANKYIKLSKILNKRIYLYPITIFKNLKEEIDTSKLEYIDKNIYRYKNILILSMGLFLIQNDLENITRSNIEDEINKVLEFIGIDLNECNYYYTAKARRDLWLY